MRDRKVIDVERLLEWTYRQQRAHQVVDHGVGLHQLEAWVAGIERQECSTLAAVERFGMLGCFVDGGGHGSGALHEDAERVHEIVSKLHNPSRLLLITNANKGSRPDWGGRLRIDARPIWKVRPRYQADGTPHPKAYVIQYRRNRPFCCPVVFVDHTPFRVELQADYRAWYAGLMAVASAIEAAPLANHVVTGPMAAAEPWELKHPKQRQTG